MSLGDDATLVAGVLAHDEATFTRLVQAWTPTMRHVARAHVSTDASADEVVQDTWLAVLQGIERFRQQASLKTWVFRILVNTAKTRGVRERRTVPVSSLSPDDGPTVDPARFRGPDDPYPGHWRSFPDPWPTPETGAQQSDVRAVVAEAIGSLPDRQRTVITLRDVQGFDADEVCDLLDISPGNQRVLLHRARAAVRARLELYYGSAARWSAS